MTDKYNLADLVAATVEQKPNDFEDAFRAILVDRLNVAIDAKKVEVAQSMFNGQVSDEE